MTIRALTQYQPFPSGAYTVWYKDDFSEGHSKVQLLAMTPDDLESAWEEFAEGRCELDAIECIELVQSDIEIMAEFLERDGARICKGTLYWYVEWDDGSRRFGDWRDLVEYMYEQNVEMSY